MILYAIKDIDTNLFVTRNHELDLLGDTTLFFDSLDDVRQMLTKDNEKQILGFSPIYHKLVWNDLEKRTGKNRWYIDITRDELRKELLSYNLKAVRIELNEKEETN